MGAMSMGAMDAHRLEKKFREIRAALAGNTGDERFFHFKSLQSKSE